MSRYRLALAVAGTFALAGCASTPEDPNAPQACITIDNTQGGAAGRISLIKDGGERIRLGQVSMGRTMRQCIRRSALVGNYRVVVEGGSSDTIDPTNARVPGSTNSLGLPQGASQAPLLVSDIFRLNPGDEVEWNVRLNRIRFTTGGN